MRNLTDYSNSILNLSNSIIKYFGADYTHSTLKIVDDLLEKNKYDNVVLMIFDAMGSRNLIDIMPEDSFLRKHMKCELSSVFPPTTTAATTTLESGLAPAEHGWLGWSLHFPEVNDNVNIFINTNDSGEQVAGFHVAGTYIPYKNVIDKINEAGMAEAESVSPFGTHKIEEFDELFDEIEDICEQKGRHYIYSYWPEPDHSMHLMGVKSSEAVNWIKRINSEVEKLSKRLQNTLLIVAADHGHIDGTNEFIGDYMNITDKLKWLPSIEPRALAFHVKPGMHESFRNEFLKKFGDDFLLLSREEVLEQKLFGDGRIRSHFEEFIGDFIGIAVGSRSIFNSREEYEKFVGVHAGMTEEEMMVPLILIEC